MNMLSLFPAIPLLMMLGLWLSKSTRQIRAVMVAGSSLLLVLAAMGPGIVTAMAGNPLAVSFASHQQVTITWGTWALAAIVPGLVALATMPWVMSKAYPPSLRSTPEAPAQARQQLREVGPMSRAEWIMLATFVVLLLLWVLGGTLGINATAAAFLGVAILLVTKVLTWKDMAKNSGAWSTLIFFSVLVGMATHLNTLGVIDWIGNTV